MRYKWAVPVLLLVAPLLAVAQGEADRGVARVSLINGDVSTQRGDSGDWIAAAVNQPLVAGDKIVAARASRAEVQFDSGNFLRLGENSEVRLANLENGRYQLQIARGIVTYRILRDAQAQIEIDTPAVAVRPLQRGTYRIYVMENGESEITVRDGRAEIASRQGTEELRSGRTLMVRMGATDNDVQVQELAATGRDEWDRWNEQRDQQIMRSVSSRYVDPSVYGTEDLDSYGSWNYDPSYGYCWYPRVAAGWAPYTTGRWVWVDWYGWTWVDYAPWGWAPFHYGRWYWRTGFGWGWYPGPRVYSAWSPALVGFFGFGRHSGVSVGFGFGYSNIGWVPLAPGERFYPWYGRGYYGRTVVNNVNVVNVTNVTNIRNVYRNANVNGGVAGVDAQNFGRTGSVRRVNATDIRDAGQIRGLVPAVPDRQSLRVTDRDVRSSSIAQSGRGDRFFSRQQPAAVERVPFSEQQQQMSRALRGNSAAFDGRRGDSPAPAAAPSAGAGGSIRALGESNSAGRAPQVSSPAATQSDGGVRGGGWRSVGQDRRSAVTAPVENPRAVAPATVQPSVAQPSTGPNVDRSDGWRRFGDRGRGAEVRQSAPSVTAPAQTAPAAVAPTPSVDRNVNRGGRGDSDWRRFGQPGRDPQPRMEAAPPRSSAPEASAPRRESPFFGSQSAPSADRGSRGMDRSMERSNRQLEIHRPITVERSARPAVRQESGGGGGGRGAPPARSGGGDRGGDRGGHSERGGGGRR